MAVGQTMSQLTDDRLNSLGLISRGGGGSRGQEGRTSIMVVGQGQVHSKMADSALY